MERDNLTCPTFKDQPNPAFVGAPLHKRPEFIGFQTKDFNFYGSRFRKIQIAGCRQIKLFNKIEQSQRATPSIPGRCRAKRFIRVAET